jgi:hypothetical protein
MHILQATPDEIVLSNLGKFAAGVNHTERDLLCLMILFHTHRIGFRRPILPERPDVMELAALTQRSAAMIAADAWFDRTDTERTDYAYWYHLFNKSGPYEVMEDVPPDLRDTILTIKARLLEHPDIASVEVEE